MLSTIRSIVSEGRERKRLHENRTITRRAMVRVIHVISYYFILFHIISCYCVLFHVISYSFMLFGDDVCFSVLWHVLVRSSLYVLVLSKCPNTIHIAAIRWAHDAAKSTHSNSGNPLRSRCNYPCNPVFFKCVSNHKHVSIYTCTYKSLMDMVTLAVQRQSRTKIRATCHCDNGARKTRRSTSCDGNTQAATLSNQ